MATPLNASTQKWLDKLKWTTTQTSPAPIQKPVSAPTSQPVTAPTSQPVVTNQVPDWLARTPTAPIPATQQVSKPLEFTPKQAQMMVEKWGSKQNAANEIFKLAKAKWMDWNTLLNAFNVAFDSVPWLTNEVVSPAVWNKNMVNLPSTDKYFEDMINNAKDPEAAANMAWLRNDYTWFFQRNEEIASQIEKWFPWLDEMITQWGQLTNTVWNEFLDKLQTERDMFLQRNQELKQRVEDTYKTSADRINNIYAQEWARVAWAAAASWMSGWPEMAARARINAQVFEEQDKLAKEELEQYKWLANNVDAYMQWYVQTYWQSRDKYVIDNYNNMLNLKSSLLMNIKNLEMQDKDLAARSAENNALANAIGWKASWWTPTSNLAWGWEAAPNIPKVNVSKWGQLINTPLRENVEPRNPDLFKNLPKSTQDVLINTYWNTQQANTAVDVVSKNPSLISKFKSWLSQNPWASKWAVLWAFWPAWLALWAFLWYTFIDLPRKL